jgi:DNA mismatch endonuclease (patch repair protein)
MVDIVNARTRSRMMAGIRSRDTKPERIVRSYLHRAGLRFRLHSTLPGRPDVTLPKYRAAIFVHGCFWHRHKNCALAYLPKSRIDFWAAKFSSNVARDRRVQRILRRRLNWRVFIVWECNLRGGQRDRYLASLLARIRANHQ